jgi:hypothetical protein
MGKLIDLLFTELSIPLFNFFLGIIYRYFKLLFFPRRATNQSLTSIEIPLMA